MKYSKIIIDVEFDEYERLFLHSIGKVRKDFVAYNNIYHVERVFAYELYYNIRNKLNRHNPNGLLLNGEITKYFELNKKWRSPDLVLHGGYDPITIGNGSQHIICEIKSSRNEVKVKEFKKDIRSLAEGIHNLNYHYGVFILLGTQEKLKELIKKSKVRKPKEIKKILTVCVSHTGTPEYDWLETLLID